MTKNYVGDVPPIELDAGTDLAVASVLEIRLKKPNGAIVILDADVYQTTKARHITIPGELDQPGIYRAQIFAALPDSGPLGETFEFTINRPYT